MNSTMYEGDEVEAQDHGCFVCLTNKSLDVQTVMDKVRSPEAGAIVIFAGAYDRLHIPDYVPPTTTPVYSLVFISIIVLYAHVPNLRSPIAGTTRNNVDGQRVRSLSYSAYPALASRTMLGIARRVRDRHGLHGVALFHRLGAVPVGEESIVVAVAAKHRREAWRAGEEALEECKAMAEVWKREEFEDGESVWRANLDVVVGETTTNRKVAWPRVLGETDLDAVADPNSPVGTAPAEPNEETPG